MELKELIEQRVHDYYWEEDLNCATTMLKTLGEIYKVKLDDQVLDAAIAMHGAGKFGAQCGLVEGTLMFYGVLGRKREISNGEIVKSCYDFADQFQEEFGSLLCRELRPEGFADDNPPHLCEDLTKRAVEFSAKIIIDNSSFNDIE
ncbi:putative redox-active protein with C_GCAxxG_C_C motif [Orenia metallireducens]|uniref:C-GCAxxG-C-C family protein n=1 Tax=Orenia metallireducens TaxID=1413210 RepID=UPI000D06BE6C|nr:C-GCAxxG-C-C family protein [Orenia metallireducens]PRX29347.1 putative redox-active protein with C_GCAxxG_C_C motif [Orenia metallireducens]